MEELIKYGGIVAGIAATGWLLKLAGIFPIRQNGSGGFSKEVIAQGMTIISGLASNATQQTELLRQMTVINSENGKKLDGLTLTLNKGLDRQESTMRDLDEIKKNLRNLQNFRE